ncbi:MAG: DUF5674 family protein [Candidatus Andersenbacteria bacterium]
MSDIILINTPISAQQLKEIAAQRFGDLVKAVVDIEKKTMAVGGELHADAEAFMLDHGSVQTNLWGINIYPNLPMPEMIEFDSMINIRPSVGNPSRNVEDEEIRKKILFIVTSLITQ